MGVVGKIVEDGSNLEGHGRKYTIACGEGDKDELWC